jgi:hypothetical protein
MQYHGKEDEWYLINAWNEVINTIVVWCPALFGCRRVTLKTVSTQREFDNLSEILKKLGAVKVGEAIGSAEEGNQYFFRIGTKPVALLVEKNQPVKIVAPPLVIEHIDDKLKVFLS